MDSIGRVITSHWSGMRGLMTSREFAWHVWTADDISRVFERTVPSHFCPPVYSMMNDLNLILSKQTKTIYCKSCFSVLGIHCIFRYEYFRAIELRWQQGCCQCVGSLQVSLYIGSASIVTCSKETGKWILLWLGRKTPSPRGIKQW
jgi:hypothetical protein